MDVVLSACTKDMWERRVIQIQTVWIVLVVIMFLFLTDERGKSHPVLTQERNPLFQDEANLKHISDC